MLIVRVLQLAVFAIVYIEICNAILLPNRTFSQFRSGIIRDEINMYDQSPGELCNRPCSEGDQRICYFKFFLENYHAMGPACGKCSEGILADCFNTQCIPMDGIEKGVMSINRKIPGPPIHVCHNDLIVVDVANLMAGSSSTIHWHGPHQRETPYMDGVPFITQCPIEYSTTFRYTFWAREAGTQWYHSHSGHQKVNGHYGALIIRTPIENDPNHVFYDFDLPEHVMLVSDWMHETADMFMPGLPTRPGGILPDTVLINGHGKFLNRTTNKRTNTPLQIYNVQQDKRYRFRFINSLNHVCPVEIQVENHRIQVIASDSYNVIPKHLDTLYSTAGERYDFVIEANQPARDYWIRVRLIGPCISRGIEQFAILRYSGAAETTRNEPDFSETYPVGVSLNHPNSTCFDDNLNDFCMTELSAYEDDQDLKFSVPDYKFFVAFDTLAIPNNELFVEGHYRSFMNLGGNLNLVGALNRLQFAFPSVPLLSQRNEISESLFCDEGFRPAHCIGSDICACVHRLKVPLNAIVELVLVDETDNIRNMNHPFHLHGYKLMVTNMGQHPNGFPMTLAMVKAMDRTRTLPVAPRDHVCPFKDTISIPSKGFTVIRFRATNPGFWLMHCHFEWHMGAGMGLVLQVGEHHEMVPTPPDFPKCGNYLPNNFL